MWAKRRKTIVTFTRAIFAAIFAEMLQITPLVSIIKDIHPRQLFRLCELALKQTIPLNNF